MTDRRPQARKHLDARFQALRQLLDTPRPHRGWIRAIREALGMSAAELADRLGVTQPTISDLERSERQDTIRLETLRRVADGLDCDLVYLLVPRRDLETTVWQQARRKAAIHLAPIAHHSRLEDQEVSDADAVAQLDELAGLLIDRRGLWSQQGA